MQEAPEKSGQDASVDRQDASMRRQASPHAEDASRVSELDQDQLFEVTQVNSWDSKYNLFRYLDIKYKVRNPYIITAFAVMGGLMFGFMSENIGPFIGTGNGPKTAVNPNGDGRYGYTYYFGKGPPERRTISAIDQAGLSAAYPGGAFIGSLISSAVADRLGRRIMFQILSFVWLIGSAIQCAANNRVSLSWGRIIAGASIGIASSTVPLYIAEMSPPRIRSRLVSTFQLALGIGILIMYFISYGSSKLQGEASFRLAWGLQMIPGFIMLIGTLFLHESPRWLAASGNWKQSRNVLCFLRNAGPENPDVHKELMDYAHVIRSENTGSTTILDLFRGHSLNRTILALSAQVWQQLQGNNAVLYYTSSIITMTGYGDSVFRFTVIMYCVYIGSTFVAVLFSIRWSRRWTFIVGSIWQMTSIAIIGGLLGVYGEPYESSNSTLRQRIAPQNADKGKAALAFSYIYFAGYCATWSPLAWVYLSEVFPSNQRGYGNGLGSAMNWLFNLVVTISTPPGFINITYKMYVIFAVFGFVAVLHVFFFYPETYGRSLEEMDEIFRSGWPIKTDPVYLRLSALLHKKRQPFDEESLDKSDQDKENVDNGVDKA